MPLSKYKKFCYRIFGHLAEKRSTDKLRDLLVKANVDIRAGAYLAYMWMNTIIAAVVSGVIWFVFMFFILPFFDIHVLSIPFSGSSAMSPFDMILFVLLFLVPFGIALLTYFLHTISLNSKARYRGKKIDHNLPYALNFISAMSAAGIAPHEIFISLSKQGIYGEVREEAARIAKDMRLLGMDIISALKKTIERTPSQRFREFLQGAIVTVTSGGALKPYFMIKADQYMRENRQIQKKFLETLGIMAEAYVTTAVAGPLFILIVITLLSMIQGDSQQLVFLYIFILLLLPLIHLAFAFTIKFMSPEV
ncbi:MAG TPA: hypothetical protein ENG74_00200 [Thermoplasmatales archaeon]|nr:hypothetical protein [Thermoplasmatales archaeon]